MDADDDQRPDPGNPGDSAQREHDRRRAARVHNILMHRPRARKDAVLSAEGPVHERAFAEGADGERYVARVLAKRLAPEARVLHDRALPRGRGNIDHIVVARSGVWVVDAKRYSGKLELWPPQNERAMLTISRRDKTHLVDGLIRQVEAVKADLAELDQPIPVYGALCFVVTELPQGRRLMFEDVHVLDAKQLVKRINHSVARLEPTQVADLTTTLARRFPVA